MNNQSRIIAYLRRHGKSACQEIEQAEGIGDATSRVSEINIAHRAIHGRSLVKASREWEFNTVTGRLVPVTYYEIDESPVTQDLFTAQ